MALDAKTVHKPFRKLEKLLKSFPDEPSPEDIHDVRTQTRRIEAIVDAFHGRKSGKSLVKTLKPIRKVAGEVRDMDVLTDFTVSLKPGGDGDCRLQLMEYLAAQRKKSAAKLARRVRAHAKRVRASLKQYGKFAEDGLDAASAPSAKPKATREGREKSVDSMATSLDLEQELRAWPKLTQKNIHPFRLKVKEWRYVLQLGQDRNSKLIEALVEVKDRIGLWHDWNELSGIAGKILDHGARCSIAAQIRARTKDELERAVKKANAFRAQYLPMRANRRKKKTAVSQIHPAVAEATARLATAG